MDVRGWEAERLRGWEVWNDVTRSLGRNIAVITTITRGRGPGAGRQSQSNVQSLKQQGGRRRCQLRLGGCWWRSQSRPLSKTKSPLPLCVGTFSVSLSRQFSWLRGHMAPVPLVWSHQRCGHSLHNCHPLITTSGDTFHRLGHLNRESVRYPVILFYDNIHTVDRTRIYYRKSKMHVLKKTGTRFLCCHSSHDC